MKSSRLAMLYLLLICALASNLCVGAQPQPAESPGDKLAPVETYGALPATSSARLSPDGKMLALILAIDGKKSLVIWDIDGKSKPRYLPTQNMEPSWFVWKSNKRLVASLRFYSIRDIYHPTVDTRLIAVDADGNNAVDLVNPAKFKTYIPQLQDHIVSFLPSDPDHILITLPAVERVLSQLNVTTGMASSGVTDAQLKYPEVVKVDINNGRLVTVVQARTNTISWDADASGNVRVAHLLNGNTSSYSVKRAADNSWNVINTAEMNKGSNFEPLAFAVQNPDRLFVLSNHEGGLDALYEMDLAQAAIVRKIAQNAHSDIDTTVRDGKLLSYRIAASSNPVYLDEQWAADARLINKAMPDTMNILLDRSEDGLRVLFKTEKGNEPKVYWLLSRTNGKAVISPIAETYPDLEPKQLGNTRYVSYPARDGLDIPALLTLPPGYDDKAGTAIPFVVLPHGGPSSHDQQGFNYLVQFIASRGYGVFQPQFRGSTGYGAAFEVAGLQQWGLAMQDDVTDGTRWLIAQKLAIPERIAIAGISYGGYAALMGAIKEPALYHCSIAIAPVTDLRLLTDDSWRYLFSDINRPRIGSDNTILDQTSPTQQAARIRVPVLLIHGKKDYTVPFEHTVRMAKALERSAAKYEAVYLPEADHYLSRGDDRTATLRHISNFLKANL